MRKPNLNEASEDYDNLMKSLNRQSIHQYAAFCSIAVARCEQAMENVSAQANAYTEAGRQFWESERESQRYEFSVDGSDFGYEEFVTEAVDCYLIAIHCYSRISQMQMCGQLYIELANILKAIKRYQEAIDYYLKSIEVLQQYSFGVLMPLQSLHCAVCCQIEMKNYMGAIESFTLGINIAAKERATKQPFFGNNSSDYLRQTVLEYEISRILLILLEQFSYSEVETEFYRISSLERDKEKEKEREKEREKEKERRDSYSPFARKIPQITETNIYLDLDSSMLLQSIMVAYRDGDLKALAHLENLLWPSSSSLQRDIFHLLIASKDTHVY